MNTTTPSTMDLNTPSTSTPADNLAAQVGEDFPNVTAAFNKGHVNLDLHYPILQAITNSPAIRALIVCVEHEIRQSREDADTAEAQRLAAQATSTLLNLQLIAHQTHIVNLYKQIHSGPTAAPAHARNLTQKKTFTDLEKFGGD